jgi:hypothetical protein
MVHIYYNFNWVPFKYCAFFFGFCKEFIHTPLKFSLCKEEEAISSSSEEKKRVRYTRLTSMRWSGVEAHDTSIITQIAFSPFFFNASCTSFASRSAGSVVNNIIAFCKDHKEYLSNRHLVLSVSSKQPG